MLEGHSIVASGEHAAAGDSAVAAAGRPTVVARREDDGQSISSMPDAASLASGGSSQSDSVSLLSATRSLSTSPVSTGLSGPLASLGKRALAMIAPEMAARRRQSDAAAAAQQARTAAAAAAAAVAADAQSCPADAQTVGRTSSIREEASLCQRELEDLAAHARSVREHLATLDVLEGGDQVQAVLGSWMDTINTIYSKGYHARFHELENPELLNRPVAQLMTMCLEAEVVGLDVSGESDTGDERKGANDGDTVGEKDRLAAKLVTRLFPCLDAASVASVCSRKGWNCTLKALADCHITFKTDVMQLQKSIGKRLIADDDQGVLELLRESLVSYNNNAAVGWEGRRLTPRSFIQQYMRPLAALEEHVPGLLDRRRVSDRDVVQLLADVQSWYGLDKVQSIFERLDQRQKDRDELWWCYLEHLVGTQAPVERLARNHSNQFVLQLWLELALARTSNIGIAAAVDQVLADAVAHAQHVEGHGHYLELGDLEEKCRSAGYLRGCEVLLRHQAARGDGMARQRLLKLLLADGNLSAFANELQCVDDWRLAISLVAQLDGTHCGWACGRTRKDRKSERERRNVVQI